jgi:hypothetical protein
MSHETQSTQSTQIFNIFPQMQINVQKQQQTTFGKIF